MILRDAWYAGAWEHELGEGQLLGLTLLNEAVVLWRTEGQVSALADRCSHRALPLSLGRVIDGVLECAYHGVCFDAGGNCVKVPGQGVPSAAIPVRAYPVVECYGLVWVWFGNADLADPETIPDVHWADDAGWVAAKGHLLVRAGHELLVENLNNHTHLQYVHSQVASDEMAATEVDVRRIGDQIEISRWLRGRAAPPHFAAAGHFTGPVDRWSHGLFTPPSTIVLDLGCAPVGTGAFAGDRSAGVEVRSMHMMSPETATTTHYFWAYARGHDLDDAALTEQQHALAESTFREDLVVLEAQQRSFDRYPAEPLMNIAVDAGGILVNRVREEIAARPLPTPVRAPGQATGHP